MRRAYRDAQGVWESDGVASRDREHARECPAAAGGPRDCDCGAEDVAEESDADADNAQRDDDIARGLRCGATVGGWR
jgi:hypothetical protein